MRVRKNLIFTAMVALIFTFSSMLLSLPTPMPTLALVPEQVQVQEQEITAVESQEEGAPAPPQHGEFEGKKFCYNTGKGKNCDCHRMCNNGTPMHDPKCKNHCFEDHCKCHTACNS